MALIIIKNYKDIEIVNKIHKNCMFFSWYLRYKGFLNNYIDGYWLFILLLFRYFYLLLVEMFGKILKLLFSMG